MDILIGLFVGIGSSLVAGLLLAWKGDAVIALLRHLPERQRIRIFTKAYVHSLHHYPGAYVHALLWLIYACAAIYALTIAISMTVSTFSKAYFSSGQGGTFGEGWFDQAGQLLDIPWIWVGLTGALVYGIPVIVFSIMLPDILRFQTHQDTTVLREFVARCGSKQDYIAYLNAMRFVHDRAGFVSLLDMAQKAIGNAECVLIKEIRSNISPDISAQQDSK